MGQLGSGHFMLLSSLSALRRLSLIFDHWLFCSVLMSSMDCPCASMRASIAAVTPRLVQAAASTATPLDRAEPLNTTSATMAPSVKSVLALSWVYWKTFYGQAMVVAAIAPVSSIPIHAHLVPSGLFATKPFPAVEVTTSPPVFQIVPLDTKSPTRTVPPFT